MLRPGYCRKWHPETNLVSVERSCTMNSHLKQDEYYVDDKDNWSVHYVTADNPRNNSGDYTEAIQVFRNGDLVGQTLWHKDEAGNNKTKAYEEGLHRIPATAREVTTRN